MEPIKGIGPKSALKLLREHGDLGSVVEHLKERLENHPLVYRSTLILIFRALERDEHAEDGKKRKGGVTVPEPWPWKEAKQVFEQPDVTPAEEIEVCDNSFYRVVID